MLWPCRDKSSNSSKSGTWTRIPSQLTTRMTTTVCSVYPRRVVYPWRDWEINCCVVYLSHPFPTLEKPPGFPPSTAWPPSSTIRTTSRLAWVYVGHPHLKCTVISFSPNSRYPLTVKISTIKRAVRMLILMPWSRKDASSHTVKSLLRADWRLTYSPLSSKSLSARQSSSSPKT